MTRSERILLVYSGVLTAALALSMAKAPAKPKLPLDQLDVQRINIVEPNGTLRMVISNHARLPGIIVRGKEKPFVRPQAGMLFYNDEGSENGGLIFGGRKNEQGEVVDSGGSLTFDKYEANQIVQLIGVDDKEDRFAGLAVVDSPTGSDTRRRVWLGRTGEGSASLQLRDANGRKRIVMQVLADGTPSLQFLDVNGKVVNQMVAADEATKH
jgi:hypothetical protein